MYCLMNESYFIQLIRALKDEFIGEVKIGDIGEEIRNAIASREMFSLTLGTAKISISETVVGTWIVMVFITLVAIWLGRTFIEVPKERQTIAESLANLVLKLCEEQHMNPKQAESVATFVGSLGIFICLSNTSSLFKLTPPAKDPVFPIALALFAVLYVIITGIRFVGFKGLWKSLTYPKAALLPFKLLDYLIKPVSLSLRLFGNIFGAFILMEFVYIIVPAILPGVIGLWFDLADGLLQGIVFAYLTIIYIGEIIEGAEASDHMKAETTKA